MNIQPFVPRQPDWKQLYYAVCLRVVVVQSLQHVGNHDLAQALINKAVEIIMDNENAIELGNSIVASCVGTGHGKTAELKDVRIY